MPKIRNLVLMAFMNSYKKHLTAEIKLDAKVFEYRTNVFSEIFSLTLQSTYDQSPHTECKQKKNEEFLDCHYSKIFGLIDEKRNDALL